MSIRATSRLWRRPWAQTIGQRALRSPPRTLAQDPYAFFSKRPRLPAQGGDWTIARFRDASASRTACPRRGHELNRQREHTVEGVSSGRGPCPRAGAKSVAAVVLRGRSPRNRLRSSGPLRTVTAHSNGLWIVPKRGGCIRYRG